jgi:hypothetical protein
MDEALKEKQLRLTMMTLELAKGHLEALELHQLAAGVAAIIGQCSLELRAYLDDPEPGLLMDGDAE